MEFKLKEFDKSKLTSNFHIILIINDDNYPINLLINNIFDYLNNISYGIYINSEKKNINIDKLTNQNIFLNDYSLRRIFFQHKYDHIYLILIMDLPLIINQDLQSCIDYVFILNKNHSNIHNILSINGSYESFCKILDDNIRNNQIILIDNYCKTRNIEDSIFLYKL